MPRYSTQHYSTLQYTTLITPHHNYNCNYATRITQHYSYNPTTLQLRLQLQLHYTILHPAVVVRWPLQTLQQLQKHNRNHLSVHQWIRSAIRDSQQPTSSIGFLFLKLPPPPCGVLLVIDHHINHDKHLETCNIISANAWLNRSKPIFEWTPFLNEI